jgi:hypothetical protein
MGDAGVKSSALINQSKRVAHDTSYIWKRVVTLALSGIRGRVIQFESVGFQTLNNLHNEASIERWKARRRGIAILTSSDTYGVNPSTWIASILISSIGKS